jgi:hypothetical protein
MNALPMTTLRIVSLLSITPLERLFRNVLRRIQFPWLPACKSMPSVFSLNSVSRIAMWVELESRMPASKFRIVPPRIATRLRPATLMPAPMPDPLIV